MRITKTIVDARHTVGQRKVRLDPGVATGDMGVGRDGKPKGSYVRSMELRGKYTLFAEGARGSLAKQLIVQKFGIGLKELWEVAPDKHQPGLVQHSLGWPLDNRTGAARSSTTMG